MLAAGVWEDAVFDELAGAIRVRRALDALAARVEVRLGTVTGVDADGTVWVGDERVTAVAPWSCARGWGRRRWSRTSGSICELRTEPHVRVTYEPAGLAACFISPEAYGVPLGRTGRYAIGMHEPGGRAGWRRRSRTCGRSGAIECVSLFAPWLDGHGDGFVELRAGRVIALGGEQRDEVRAGDR